VDTPTPFPQLSSSGTIFKGRHHKLLGTELLFSHVQGDPDPSARHISLLGTTEQRIVFSPVEIRNPASSSPSTLRSTSKAKTSGKGSGSRKSKKKANVRAGGIEDVTGSLSVGAPKSSTLVEQDLASEPGPSAPGKVAGEKGDDDDMYATEEDDGADEDRGDGTNVGGEEGVGAEEGADTSAALPPRKKRKPTRNDKGKSVTRPTEGPTVTATPVPATPIVEAELNVTPEPQQGIPSTSSGIPVAIDPVLETLQVPTKQPPPQPQGSEPREL